MIQLLLFMLFLAFYVFINALFTPLPISDIEKTRYRSIPYVTIGLIIVNCCVFMFFQAIDIYALERAEATADFTDDPYDVLYNGLRGIHQSIVTNYTYGFRAINLREPAGLGGFTTFTSMFMHGDLFHLLFNMIYLWTFGTRLEDACGPWRFLLFYLLAGMTANIASGFLYFRPDDVPGIGASGAISGVLGGYLMLFPGKTLMCLWGIGIPFRLLFKVFNRKEDSRSAKERALEMELSRFQGKTKAEYPWWTVPIPAGFLLVTYVARNVYDSIQQIQDSSGGVNYIAHVGGLVAGVLILCFVRKDLLTRWWSGRAA